MKVEKRYLDLLELKGRSYFCVLSKGNGNAGYKASIPGYQDFNHSTFQEFENEMVQGFPFLPKES